MLERMVEAKIIAAVNALGIDGLAVSGFWQPSAPGEVKGVEDSAHKSALAVKVPPKGFDTFSICEATLAVSLLLEVRADMCPTGEELSTICGAIGDMLTGWNMDEHGEVERDLSVPGVFSASGVNVSTGTGPDFVAAEGVWEVEYNLTLRGSVVHQ